MNVLLFILNNWHDFLIVVVLILSIIVGIQRWIQINGPIFKKMSFNERVAYVTRILTNLAPIALALVTNAESQFGGGTGKLKRSYVIDELYKRIPDEYKKFITEDNLDSIINKALSEAEELWHENEKAKALIHGGPINSKNTPEVYTPEKHSL